MIKIKIAIIDADLIGRKSHRFPNLACMKLSGYYKKQGNDVQLITDYKNLFSKYIELEKSQTPTFDFIISDNISNKKYIKYYKEEDIIFDKIFISKVFEDTPVPEQIKELNICEYGGTGFFYVNAPDLPYHIEHHMPDYHLYDEWVEDMIDNGKKEKEFEYYMNYSIGFTTRGCFRKCSFCVNQKYNKVTLHSPINEFLDEKRPYICLLDDNILGYAQWEQVINNLTTINKPFQYKQGMDIRLMTEKMAQRLSQVRYIGDYIFAFDHIKDKELIESKLSIWRKYCKKNTKLYILCAYDENNIYDETFWVQDIINTFNRIFILAKYDCKPYIMRFKEYENSKHRGMYINLASWCNQPHLLKKMSFKQYSIERGMNEKVYKQYKSQYDKYLNDGYIKGSCWRYMEEFKSKYPKIAHIYFDLKYEDIHNNPQLIESF